MSIYSHLCIYLRTFYSVKSNKDYLHFKLLVYGHLGSTDQELGQNYLTYWLLTILSWTLYAARGVDVRGH